MVILKFQTVLTTTNLKPESQHMKTYLTLSAAALFLTTAPLAHAGTKATAKKHTKTVETRQVNYVERVVVQDQAPTKPVQDAHGWTGGEIGNDAPHEERNPSAHPELFQYGR